MGYFNHETLLEMNQGEDLKGNIILRNRNFISKIRRSFQDVIRNTLYNIIEYEGLPEGTPEHIIEEMLYDSGIVVAWKVAGKVYFSNSFTPSGTLDAYNRPVSVQPSYLNGKVSSFKKTSDVVFIRNNKRSTSTAELVNPFIDKMVLNQEALIDNLETSMTKWALKVDSSSKDDEENVKKALNILLNRSGKVATIPSGTMDFKLEQFDFYEEFKGTEYWNDFNNTYNLLWTLLGIKSNSNEDKKERLLVDEINVYEERITLLLIGMINSRKKAIEEINDKFNTNIRMIINIERGQDNDFNNPDRDSDE